MGIAAGLAAGSLAVSAAGTANATANSGGGGGGFGGGFQGIQNLNTPLYRYGIDGNNSYSVGLTPIGASALDSFDARSAQTSAELGGVQSQLTPGFGALTQATKDVFTQARQRLADARLAATSDLRGNLEKRRVLGSSFANDTIARTQAEFQKTENDLNAQEGQIQAQNFLQELNSTVQLINQRSAVDLNAITTRINQLNILGDQARSLATGTQSVMGNLAGIQSELAAKIGLANAQGAGQAIGLGLNAASNLAGKVDLSSIFGNNSALTPDALSTLAATSPGEI